MGKIKGQVEYDKFKRGEKLTRMEAVRAHCFICNGFEEGNCDCKGKSCPLYAFHPYRSKLGPEEGSFMSAQDKEKAPARQEELVLAS